MKALISVMAIAAMVTFTTPVQAGMNDDLYYSYRNILDDRAIPDDTFHIERLDTNGDGTNESAVMSSHYCSKQGCEWVIYASMADGSVCPVFRYTGNPHDLDYWGDYERCSVDDYELYERGLTERPFTFEHAVGFDDYITFIMEEFYDDEGFSFTYSYDDINQDGKSEVVLWSTDYTSRAGQDYVIIGYPEAQWCVVDHYRGDPINYYPATKWTKCHDMATVRTWRTQ